jgi:hypothetical protein
LALWFDVAPFPLISLAGNLKATEYESMNAGYVYSLSFPPFDKETSDFDQLVQKAKTLRVEAVQKFNQDVTASQTNLALTSSSGDASFLGGVCSSDTSFSKVLQRYLAEMLPEHVIVKHSMPSVGRAAGVASYHRTMGFSSSETKEADDDVRGHMEFRDVSLESYVANDDVLLAVGNLQHACERLVDNMDSMDKLMVHLENLGHDEAQPVEGLNVELLPFQRQTLQWALDREKLPGGLQSFLWVKLPVVEDNKVPDVYYNLITEKLIRTSPPLIRGGIIAEEMGLGKTVR